MSDAGIKSTAAGIIGAISGTPAKRVYFTTLYEKFKCGMITDTQFLEYLGTAMRDMVQEEYCFGGTRLSEICELLDEAA